MAVVLREIATLALCGVVIGVLLGILAAGACATWTVGGDMATIGFGTILAFALKGTELLRDFDPCHAESPHLDLWLG